MVQNSRKNDAWRSPLQASLGPVVALFQYKNDVLIVRRWKGPQGAPDGRTGRDIWRFSDKSRRHLAFIAGNCDHKWKSMITLTYPSEFPMDGALVKCQLNKILGWLRYHYAGLRYLWVLEFQARGAPHIHILTDIHLPGCLDQRHAHRAKLARAWYKIADTGDPKHLVAGTSWGNEHKPNGLAHYAAQEAAKLYQKTVPEEYKNVGRFWGKSRNITCSFIRAWAVDEEEAREMLSGWDYLPPASVPLYRVLYNASSAI